MRKIRALALRKAARNAALFPENRLEDGPQRKWAKGCPKQVYRKLKKIYTEG
jgi:hypothetical protein